jgi:hypothetical protein
MPPTNDPDNRMKQFASTYNGAKFISLNSKATHILKIRTDQIIDPKIIDWLTNFFITYDNISPNYRKQKDCFLVFSWMLQNNPFEMGDFIFAGGVNNILSFCKTNLLFNGRNIHPSIGKDFVLKYLSKKSTLFWNVFFKGYPLLLQNYNDSAQAYWLNILKNIINLGHI